MDHRQLQGRADEREEGRNADILLNAWTSSTPVNQSITASPDDASNRVNRAARSFLDSFLLNYSPCNRAHLMAREMPPASAEAGPSRPRGAPSSADGPDRDHDRDHDYDHTQSRPSNVNGDKRKRPALTLDNVFDKQSQAVKRRVNEQLRAMQAQAEGVYAMLYPSGGAGERADG